MKNIKCRNCFFYRNEWCEKIVDSPDPEEARDCAYFREMTNADKIRSMTDEELAEFLWDFNLADVSTGKMGEFGPHMFRYRLKEWLQQPAEEDDHA